MRVTTQRTVRTSTGFGTIEMNSHFTRTSRAAKSKKTPLAMSQVNYRNASKAFYAYGFENFNSFDWHITFTFSKNVAYKERFRRVTAFLDDLKELYAQHPRWDITDPDNYINLDVLRRMLVWGKGEECEKLHAHCLANRIKGVPREDVIKLGKKHGIDIGVAKIRDCYKQYGRTEEQIVGACLHYLWKHNKTLSKNHRKLIKKYWYPSHNLVKPEQLEERIDIHILVQLDKLYQQKDLSDFKKLVHRLFPNRKIIKSRVWHSDIEPFSPPHFVCEFVEYFSLADVVLTEYQISEKTFLMCKDTGEVFSPSAIERLLCRRRNEDRDMPRTA